MAAEKSAASKSSRSSGTRSSGSRSAPSNAPAETGLPSGTVVGGGRQTPEEARAERESVQQTQVHGPGSGSRLISADGKELKLSDVAGEKGDVLVELTQDVHEEHPLPGTDRMGKSLLFHAGQKVPMSTLERHFDRQQQSRRGSRSSENKSAAGQVTETK